MSTSLPQAAVEANFDGLVGPTHNYAGLALGNLAAARHAEQPSNPRQAAREGLTKMKALADLGLAQPSVKVSLASALIRRTASSPALISTPAAA